MTALLGVDVGGTRSTAIVVVGQEVVGRADGGPANYQGIGAAAASAAIGDVVERALGSAGLAAAELGWAGYGIAGADRPKDYSAIQGQMPALPGIERRTLVNDTRLVLRAGTAEGVGVALVSGTGTNALGCGADHMVARVGGLASELGDFGSGGDLGREALRLAMRGRDGRGEPTVLYERLCAHFDLEELEDIIDLWMQGDPRGSLLGELAPLVFEAAREGDAVAVGLLERAGDELALCGRLLIERLFSVDEAVTVVLGGSVLQHGADRTLVDRIASRLAALEHNVTVKRLRVDPVYGAALLACDGAGQDAGALRRALQGALELSFAEPL